MADAQEMDRESICVLFESGMKRLKYYNKRSTDINIFTDSTSAGPVVDAPPSRHFVSTKSDLNDI